MTAPNRVGCEEAFVGVGRRHTDVDHGKVGLQVSDEREQLVGVAGLGDDVDAALDENAPQSLADEHRVVGQHYAHGISPRSRVPWPARLSRVS